MEVSSTQAAALLGKSERTIQRYIKLGKLQARRLGNGQFVVNVADLEPLRGADFDLELLRSEIDGLKSRVEALELLVQRLDEREQQSPAAPRARHVTRDEPGEALPGGLVALGELAKRHHVPETTARRAAETGLLPIVPGTWRQGRALVKLALDAEGHRRFYELYHVRRDFQRCPDCPSHLV